MITISDYFMGRDKTHAAELTDEIRANAEETVERTNALLKFAAEDGIVVSKVNSGWRPKSINDATPNAGPNSNHIYGRAIDPEDDQYRTLARWSLRNMAPLCFNEGRQDLFAEVGIWMENPMWCAKLVKGRWMYWVHWQTVAPKSGRRVYVPSESPPLAAALPEQERIRELA